MKSSVHTDMTNGSTVTNHERVELIKELLDMNIVDYECLKGTL